MCRRIARGLAIVLSVVSLGAAQKPTSSESATNRSNLTQASKEARYKARKAKPYQIGTASWYGDYFQGKPTASGEPYNMYDLTAAHPTLPLGSFVRVTNLRNGRSVVVKVNDRGPIVPGRIIDVSYSTARVLQFKAQGLQRVRLDHASGAVRDVYDPAGNYGAAIIDFDDYRAPVAQIGDPHEAAQGQSWVGGGQVVHVIRLAAGGRLALEIVSIPGGGANLVGLRLSRFVARFL